MGRQTIEFKNKPVIIGSYSIVGPKEGKGNFGPYFNYVVKDDCFGEESYEKAEKKMLESAIVGAIEDAKIKPSDVGIILSGDLLNQIISSSYAARNFDVSFLGLFGACSTMAESLAVGSSFVDSGYFDKVVPQFGTTYIHLCSQKQSKINDHGKENRAKEAFSSHSHRRIHVRRRMSGIQAPPGRYKARPRA